MSNLPDIAFIGRAGAGKTTCADILVRRFGYERLSFAEPLKVMLDTQTDRARLQEFGTDVVRAYEPDAWVRLFLYYKRLREQAMRSRAMVGDGYPGPLPFTVDDARFLNEVMQLKADGFVVVRVVAPTVTRVARLKANGKLQDESQLNHVSETELDEFPADYRVMNDGADERGLTDQLGDIINRERREAA